MSDTRWQINGPVAVVLCVLILCITALAFAGVIPREILGNAISFLIGLVLPTGNQPIATRWRTMYSASPPPLIVETDRPPPPKD